MPRHKSSVHMIPNPSGPSHPGKSKTDGNSQSVANKHATESQAISDCFASKLMRIFYAKIL